MRIHTTRLLHLIAFVSGFLIVSVLFSNGNNAEKDEKIELISLLNTSELAYATYTTQDFAAGSWVLGYALHKYSGDNIRRICLVTADVTNETRKSLSEFWEIREIEHFLPWEGLRATWTKLNYWKLIDFKKVVALDSDILPLSNLTVLFTYPQLSCASDPNPPQFCSAGFIVMEPSIDTYNDMVDAAVSKRVRFMLTGDQSFMNRYFGNWTPFPPAYNLMKLWHPALERFVAQNRSKAFHMICRKPWICYPRTEDCGCGMYPMHRAWWTHWNESCQYYDCPESILPTEYNERATVSA